MPDDVKPANSHVALNTIEDPDGTERQILRANMPFGEVGRGEFGTYYIGYAATPSVTEQMLVNMFIGDPPGNYDRILDFSTAVTGCLFFAPSADFLDDLPDPPGPPGPADTGSTDDGSLGIGSLKGSTLAMNNLYRELAPISDAAWADIEEEARRCSSIMPRFEAAKGSPRSSARRKAASAPARSFRSASIAPRLKAPVASPRSSARR